MGKSFFFTSGEMSYTRLFRADLSYKLEETLHRRDMETDENKPRYRNTFLGKSTSTVVKVKAFVQPTQKTRNEASDFYSADF